MCILGTFFKLCFIDVFGLFSSVEVKESNSEVSVSLLQEHGEQ